MPPSISPPTAHIPDRNERIDASDIGCVQASDCNDDFTCDTWPNSLIPHPSRMAVQAEIITDSNSPVRTWRSFQVHPGTFAVTKTRRTALHRARAGRPITANVTAAAWPTLSESTLVEIEIRTR
jgi:hypothetical protein